MHCSAKILRALIPGILLAISLDGESLGDPPPQLVVSGSGHYFRYGDRTMMLVGDSGTQCVLQNLNIDYRQWIGDLAKRGLNTAHIWAFVAPRQTADGSILEERYGYVYPGATPWSRRHSGPAAKDQLRQWDLTSFDDGEDPRQHYWPRLRDLAQCCQEHKLCLGITLFFGWPKHEKDWQFHPFHKQNGGHLLDRSQVVRIATPGKEVLTEAWSSTWQQSKKTQWIWERYCQKMIDDLSPFKNVFFHYKDERSYDGGWGGFRDNMDDHFVQFFRQRGKFIIVDWTHQRDIVDVVLLHSGTLRDRLDLNRSAVSFFSAKPVRPVICLEGGPYRLGDPSIRTHMWTFAIGGGHFVFHDDQDQGTVTTGIMGYDPQINGTIPLQTYDWLGSLSRFFNQHVRQLDRLSPANDLIVAGKAYCLSDRKTEYACYLPEGSAIRLKMTNVDRRANAIWYDPRTGDRQPADLDSAFSAESVGFSAPDQQDWALLIQIDETH
jgi:hypothetical protein